MAKATTMDPTRKAYEDKMQAQIDMWKSQINGQRAKLQMMDAENRINGQRNLQKIESRYEQISKDFERLTAASASKWEEIKLSVTAAADQIGREIQDFR